MFDKQIIFMSCCIQLIVTFTMHKIAMDRTVKFFYFYKNIGNKFAWITGAKLTPCNWFLFYFKKSSF